MGDKWSIHSALLCSLFPLFHLPESSRNPFKTSPSLPFEKVSVAGPIQAVIHCFFFLLFRRYIKTIWHFKMLEMWLLLSPEHMHCLRLTKTLLSAYFYLGIYRHHTGKDCGLRLNWKAVLYVVPVKTPKIHTWNKLRRFCFNMCFFFKILLLLC